MLFRSGSDRYDFIVANYANPDMVGHTGIWAATLEALAAVDVALARVLGALEASDARDPDGAGSILAITADHGNADDLRDADGGPVTAHSLNPVPLLVAGRAMTDRSLRDGDLADVAPTLLEFAGLPRWDEMTGRSLLRGAAPAGGPGGAPTVSTGRPVVASAAEPAEAEYS